MNLISLVLLHGPNLSLKRTRPISCVGRGVPSMRRPLAPRAPLRLASVRRVGWLASRPGRLADAFWFLARRRHGEQRQSVCFVGHPGHDEVFRSRFRLRVGWPTRERWFAGSRKSCAKRQGVPCRRWRRKRGVREGGGLDVLRPVEDGLIERRDGRVRLRVGEAWCRSFWRRHDCRERIGVRLVRRDLIRRRSRRESHGKVGRSELRCEGERGRLHGRESS